MTTVTLLDGTEVDSTDERYRYECEARAIADLPTLAERRRWLDDVERNRRRGKPVADRLRATLLQLWEQRDHG